MHSHNRQEQPVARQDITIAGEPGISLFVREVRLEGHDQGVPVLLLHGARVPGLASFDLPVPFRQPPVQRVEVGEVGVLVEQVTLRHNIGALPLIW